MADTKPEIIRDPKYDPPYPQEFHRFWPRHAIKAGIVVVITIAVIVLLAWFYRVPTDHNMPPLPDEGMYLPAPEWYLIFLFQPFWYLTGEQAVWRPLGTFWIPLVVLVSLLLLPLVFGKKRAPGEKVAASGKLLMAAGAVAVWAIMGVGVVGSGYHAKTNGCISCHTPMMGIRQALPPADMAEYYRKVRKMQIEVGKYRAGITTGEALSYKDANWQLRHYYEPGMTW
jgi:hypothetical protein